MIHTPRIYKSSPAAKTLSTKQGQLTPLPLPDSYNDIEAIVDSYIKGNDSNSVTSTKKLEKIKIKK